MTRISSVYFTVIAVFIIACGHKRPQGKEAEEFMENVNAVTRPFPKGSYENFYGMLSQEFISAFEDEIEKAKTLDSTQVRLLPRMEMLRVLSLKNSYAQLVKSKDTRTIIISWLEAAGKGFPLKNADRYYYSAKTSIESEALRSGATFPQILIVREESALKVNPFNTPEYQELRLNNILKKHSLEELIKESAWMYFQTYRPINWGPLN